MAKYGVVHTTNIRNMKLYDFQSTVDVQNGTLLAKGNLISGERNIYDGVTATDADKLYLVANPAWSYDEGRTTNQNEDEFINKAGVAFRVYGLDENDRFRVSSNMIHGTPVKDYYVDYDYNVSAAEPTSAFIGKIVDIDELGFNWHMGSVGQVDNTEKMVLIEVVKNEVPVI